MVVEVSRAIRPSASSRFTIGLYVSCARGSTIPLFWISPSTAQLRQTRCYSPLSLQCRSQKLSNQIKFIKQQRALLQVAKTFNRHKTNKRYMYTLLITRDVAFLFIYLFI